ncbi:uncharacterized protein LOC135378008 isoform X2 [Ornithodoros turicata]|uniref:uncharacterized protein LOC135378008 isoform X2 n=1 Tax=Ornithodoros turicata TaxID=34597 RepID=UPI003139F830
MANLRRHFNFGSKPGPLNQFGSSHGHQTNTEGVAFPDHCFSRSAFMNEVCTFLDNCSAYVQALNTFCGSSSALAKSLVRVFHNVSLYREAAALFLGAWEDLGRVTAAASAAVKTETLMTLQDVLNKLEGEGDDSAALTECIQAVGCCLGSYVELQLQFSYSTWKALSKLSKNMPTDGRGGKSAVPKSSAELTATIKKHFASLLHKVGAGTKQGGPVGSFSESQPTQFHVDFMNQPGGASSMEDVPAPQSNLPPSQGLQWHGAADKSTAKVPSSDSTIQDKEQTVHVVESPGAGELEEVINLLSAPSCGGPLPKGAPMFTPDNAFLNGMMASLAPGTAWPPEGISNTSSSTHLFSGKLTWPRPTTEGIGLSAFGVDPFLWRTVGQVNPDLQSNFPSSQSDNSCGLWSSTDKQGWSSILSGENGSSSDETSSNNGQDTDSFLMGLNLAGRDLVASVRQRRHSSSDGPPEGIYDALDVCSDPNSGWPEVRAVKTSTWPLKQSGTADTNPATAHSSRTAGMSTSGNNYFLFGHGS